ncbi:DUF1624 domain-containing protein [Sphingomonas sp. VDB2]|uniref:DUF1624 domain-containing protein n=1 Tax=Sphingomonas sp. VDB2 TaxID=3228751 RepID=UPI003A80F848
MATATFGGRTPAKAPSQLGDQARAKTRLLAIDALRGLVMIIMLVDHVRETWFLHHQVTDPMNALTVDPALFFTRLTSQICAPVFVALTGLSAWLFGQSHSKAETSLFLIKRGLFLMVMDVTLITFAWSTTFPPKIFWLQVIWTIGICMIILAGLIHLPSRARIAIGLVILFGHNLLDGIILQPGDSFYVPWAMLHQRATIDLGAGFVARTTYPVLPWIGVILLGHAIGPWFASDVQPAERRRRLMRLGLTFILGFVALRFVNAYGDKPWFYTGETIRTVMSFLALTKYPPSLLFLLPTLGLGAVLLAFFERRSDAKATAWLAALGSAPMFYYILHIYVLRTLYNSALLIWGPNHGPSFGVESIVWVWIWSVALILPLYYPSKWFAQYKRDHRDQHWLRYL